LKKEEIKSAEYILKDIFLKCFDDAYRLHHTILGRGTVLMEI